MSFLDNLENNLKSLESHEEGNDAAEQQRRDAGAQPRRSTGGSALRRRAQEKPVHR